MQYRVRFTYQTNIDAASLREAIQTVTTLMQEHPETFIRDVEQAALGGNKRPLWKRFLTGR